MLDADCVQAIRDELDHMSADSLLNHARRLHLDGPPMKPELRALRERKLHEINQTLRSRRQDERDRALDALKAFCFNEELRRRSGG
jgi:hypothetical protein